MNRQLKWTDDHKYFVTVRRSSGRSYADGAAAIGATWPVRCLKAHSCATGQRLDVQSDQILEWLGDLLEIEPSPDFKARFWARVRAGDIKVDTV